MTNAAIAARLNEIAALMEFDGEPFFKIKAYERAARSLDDLESPVQALIASGELQALPGVGKAIAQKIIDIEATGTCKYLEELRAKFPPTVLDLLHVPGVGAKTAAAMYKELGITGIDDLRRALDDGSLARLPRMGAKGIENIRRGLAHVARRTSRMRLGDAWEIAHEIIAALAERDVARNLTAAGSLRRMEPTVGDIDIICTSEAPGEVLARFVELPCVERVEGHGDTKATIWASAGISVDCRVVRHECFGNLLQHFTGNKTHNVKLREFALRKKLSVSEYGIEDLQTKAVRTMTDEAEVYAALALPFIPPELRIGADEIELARRNALPALVQLTDLRGDLHCHTTWSDGTRSIAQMARAAAKRGRDYLSISDHSPGRSVAHGLSIERLHDQMAEVRAEDGKHGVRLFLSSEVDIKADGRLDLPDEVLAELDIVVASIHSSFAKSKEDQTRRLIAAVRNPYVTIIGHPTGALIEERPGYEFDYDAVFKEAAATGTALEINSNPARLDLSAQLAARARDLGCTLAIDSDAHREESFDYLRFGVGTARRAALTKKHVLNTRSADDVLAFAKRKRSASFS